jgi:hypothetical protein
MLFNNSMIPLANIMEELAADERAHVNLIRQALIGAGVRPVAKPAINLSGLGFGFGGQVDFLLLARVLEDVGVSAYGGAAPLIQSKDILGVAARILSAEAFHAGNIRLVVSQNRYTNTPVDRVDIPAPPSGKFFPTDAAGLSAVRTPGQVLFLTYGLRANAMGGGLYPAGMNGKLKMSSAAA